LTAKQTPRNDEPRPDEEAVAAEATLPGDETTPAGHGPDPNGPAAPAEQAIAAEEQTIITGNAINELTVRLEEAESRAGEYLDSLQRERAAFQNYRRRVERERAEQAQVIAGDLLLKLLPTLDDFYRAMEAVPQDERNQWVEGIALILRKFERFLADEGVVEIEALGQPFDPALHEAVGVDHDSGAASGTITAVLQRGYRLGDRVLRPALVRVAG
jgi:molecular chaperone GrpE